MSNHMHSGSPALEHVAVCRIPTVIPDTVLLDHVAKPRRERGARCRAYQKLPVKGPYRRPISRHVFLPRLEISRTVVPTRIFSEVGRKEEPMLHRAIGIYSLHVTRPRYQHLSYTLSSVIKVSTF